MELRHIVLFRVRDGIPKEKVDEAISALRSLSDAPGLLDYRVEESLDARKGVVIVENALFIDRGAFESFRSSSAHSKAADVLKEVSDWWIGDYPE